VPAEIRFAESALDDLQGIHAWYAEQGVADVGVRFVGDLVNRGPSSLDVLRFVADLGDRAHTVLGNHDLHLVASARGVRRLRGKDTFHDVLEAADGEALAFPRTDS